MLTGLLSFLGVIIGATLQYSFTRHIENQRFNRELRSSAYMDYLKCVCEQTQFQPQENSQAKKELFVRITDAKARICLYGSNSSIQAFSNFEKLGASISNDKQIQAFTNMISIMRTDSGSEKGVGSLDLQNTLLGIDKNEAES